MAGEEDTSTTNGQDAGWNNDNQDRGGDGTLMTKDLGGKGGVPAHGAAASAKEASPPEHKGEQDAIPDNPEGYDFKFGKDTPVDKELLGDFRKAAHELGISQGKAQRLASLYEAHAARAGERAHEARQRVLDEARAKWEGEIEKSPTFTQDRENIRAALRQYGDRDLYDLLNQTNLGSHPKMWAFMARIGKELAEPGFRGESAGKGPKSAAEVLYPNQGK